MFSTILLFTITMSSIVLSYYTYKYYYKVKELELKLKITKDYANKKAIETFDAKTAAFNKQVAKKAVIQAKVETTVQESIEPVAKKSRRRKKKVNNTQP